MALVEISQAQGKVPVTVFHIQDRINLGNATELEKIAKDAYANGMRDLVIDLTKAPSITSAGIRSLVVIYKMLATDDKKHCKLAGVPPQVREVLEIAGITETIEIYDTVDEAVASF
jgi:anti-anti-sigma factor